LYNRQAMAFFLGLILFVGVAGWLDRRIPWPKEPPS
jgi:hypothetical protein